MSFLNPVPEDQLPPEQRVLDQDNIIQVHRVNPAVMRQHYDLYVQLMHKASPLTRVQREMVAVVVSGLNECHY
jgi:alkylhydroperoxidase family enzyme